MNTTLRYAFLAFLFASCSLVGEETTPRTYPEALTVEPTTIFDLNRTVPLPGTYNIVGFVIGINECPSGSACAVADGITLFERKDKNPSPEEWLVRGIHLHANRPSQFDVGTAYIFSVEVKEARDPNLAQPYARLLGYDRVR